MPYSVGKSSSCPVSKPHAVLKQDGTVVPGGCHATHAEALRHQRALQTNVVDANEAQERFVAEMMAANRPEGREALEEIVSEAEPYWAKDFSTEKRKKMAKSGSAMPDGSYPIENCQDVSNAVQAIGRAPESKRPAVKAHIKRRAKSLGCTNVPADW